MMENQNLLWEYVKEIGKSHDLSPVRISEILAEAFKKVYLREFPNNKLDVKIDLDTGKIQMFRYLEVVDDNYFYEGEGDEDDETLIPWSIAQELAAKKQLQLKIGDHIKKPINIQEFDNKTVRSILTIFRQLTIEEVNRKVCEEWVDYEGKVLSGVVEKIDENHNHDIRGAVVLITNDAGLSTKAYITRQELVQFVDHHNNRYCEKLEIGMRYFFYVKNVHEISAGWPVNLSRIHGDLVKHYLSMHVSEIADGIVEVVDVARIAGNKSKVFVRSHSLNVDPIGACLGPKGRRLKAVSDMLVNEKIDIILWTDNEIKNVINACTPGKVMGYYLEEGEPRTITLIIDHHENFSAIIGRKGVNVRLASMLTHWTIDVKKEQDALEEHLDFQLTADLFENDNKPLSQRIYERHKFSNETELRSFDEEDDQY